MKYKLLLNNKYQRNKENNLFIVFLIPCYGLYTIAHWNMN